MPPRSATPITFLASAPVPVAITKGNTPRIKEKAVINMGLNLDFDAEQVGKELGKKLSEAKTQASKTVNSVKAKKPKS